MAQNNNSLRFRDVLIALDTAKTYNYSLNRLQLQKLIYLGDTLALVWELLANQKGHETYRHGPYDLAIQNAVDILAFRGIVRITEFEVQSGGIHTRYEITDCGCELLNEITKEGSIKIRRAIYKNIGKLVNDRGWSRLKEIVYAEPTFVSQRGLGWGTSLSLNSMCSNLSLQLLWSFKNIAEIMGKQITPENLTNLYFEVLDSYLELSIN